MDNAFRKIIWEGRKPSKIWVAQGGEFYNKLFKRFLKINSIEMYSTYNEGKSAVAKRYVEKGTLKNKIFKHMTAVSKNLYFDVLDDIVNKHNNGVHRSIKMKPIDVTSGSYAEYNEDSNVTKPKLKVGVHVRISKYKKFLIKATLKISQKKFLLLVELKIQFCGLLLLVTWMVNQLLEVFMKKNSKKLVKKNSE